MDTKEQIANNIINYFVQECDAIVCKNDYDFIISQFKDKEVFKYLNKK